jgi:hypothetical protein
MRRFEAQLIAHLADAIIDAHRFWDAGCYGLARLRERDAALLWGMLKTPDRGAASALNGPGAES